MNWLRHLRWPLISPKRLAEIGILGMNGRNIDFISRYNPRHCYPLVDDKLKTKLLAQQHGLSTPRLRLIIQSQHQVNHLAQALADLSAFVIKPARGSGGKGITVITQRDGEQFLKASGQALSLGDLQRHLSNILAGIYSLAGAPDIAIIEDLIQPDPYFRDYSYEGVPDIRVIVFKGYPVMSMLRLSTHASDGKANLHQGAVGVGLDIASGRAIYAVQFGRRLEQHPDTHRPLAEICPPHWSTILTLAVRCQQMTGLGYLGADIVLDAQHGPTMLELNARPGLAIQVANGCGLLPRLRHIESLRQHHSTPHDCVNYAMQQFAGFK